MLQSVAERVHALMRGDANSAANASIVEAWRKDRGESAAAAAADTQQAQAAGRAAALAPGPGEEAEFDPDAEAPPLPFGRSNVETHDSDRCDVKVSLSLRVPSLPPSCAAVMVISNCHLLIP
jgi:hypothetical protein